MTRGRAHGAFTLLELLVVVGLVALVLGVAVSTWSNLGRAQHRLTSKQDRFDAAARLGTRLRRDLRSAVGLQCAGNGSCTLTIATRTNEGWLAYRDVWYEASEPGTIVRRSGDERTTYVFAADDGTPAPVCCTVDDDVVCFGPLAAPYRVAVAVPATGLSTDPTRGLWAGGTP